MGFHPHRDLQIRRQLVAPTSRLCDGVWLDPLIGFTTARRILNRFTNDNRIILLTTLRAKLSQRELAERMGTTQAVISRLEEGGGARNRLDIRARVATALDRRLVVSSPEVVPKRSKDAVQVA